MPLRLPLLALIVAALLPVVVFGGLIIARLDAQQRDTVEVTLRQSARTAMQAIDRQLAEHLALMTALSASPSLDRADTGAFRLHADRVLQREPQWLAVRLIDTSTREVLVELRSIVAQSRPAWPVEANRALGALADDTAHQIGGVRSLAAFPEPVVTIRVPVTYGESPRHAVEASIKASAFSATLAHQPVDAEWTLAVLDRNRYIVGRSRAPEQFVNTQATPSLTSEIDRAAENFFFSLNKEGDRVFSAFSQSVFSGWTVAVGVPAVVVEAPIRRALLTSLGGGVGAGLLALAFIAALVRNTARRQAAERQLEAERRLGDIAANFPGSIFRRALLPDGTMEYRYLGGQIEAMVGQLPFDLNTPAGMERFSTLIHPEDIGLWRETVIRSAKMLESYRIEGRLVRTDGSICWVRSAANVHREPDGTVIWDGVVLDINDQKAAEAERAQLAAIVASATDAIFSTDLEDRIVTWNAAAAEIYGLAPEEVIGLSTGVLVPPALAEERRSLIERSRRGESVREHETVRFHKNGTRFDVALTISPIRQSDGTVTGFSTIVRDISERKRAEADLRRSLAERESLLQEVHHRVKNNLQVIAAMVQLEIPQTENPEVRDRMTAIAQRVQAMGRVHEQLYTTGNLASVEFGDYLRSLAEGLAALHAGHPVQLETDIEAGGLSCDLDLAVPLGLIANELITNAFKHAFPDGRAGIVRIGLRRAEDGRMEMRIEDNGVGMGGRAPGGASGRKGMGTTLIRALVRQTRAELRYESEDGADRGTRAVVKLMLSR
ncbi:PAS domain S-box protein [Azospirillum sp. SYSU D00513]|uniref:sensor histidine kinase n=1 Tax=Azospirillum sp. SYSU D00513 TaxID=2812561 RepID=UPI001A97A5F9|nr:PAS domain S-box protein [Azospirillum sp. SYSU D00513]